MGEFYKRLSAAAFGGSDYSPNTLSWGGQPRLLEPYTHRINDSYTYFYTWASGRSFGAVAWHSQRTIYMQASRRSLLLDDKDNTYETKTSSLRLVPLCFHKRKRAWTGAFQNLDFESATIVPVPGDPNGLVQWSAAMLQWTGYIGSNVVDRLVNNGIGLSVASMGILGPDFPAAGEFQGHYYVKLKPGFWSPAAAAKSCQRRSLKMERFPRWRSRSSFMLSQPRIL